MSILSHITGAITGAVKGFASGGITGAIAGGAGGLVFGKGGTVQSKLRPGTQLTSMPGVGFARTNLGPLVATAGGRLPGMLGTAATVAGAGMMLYDAMGNPVSRRRRRMNPMNARAARRAIRRIKGARKMLMSIERQLPKQRTHRAPPRGRQAPEFLQLRNS